MHELDLKKSALEELIGPEGLRDRPAGISSESDGTISSAAFTSNSSSGVSFAQQQVPLRGDIERDSFSTNNSQEFFDGNVTIATMSVSADTETHSKQPQQETSEAASTK